jgi:EpsI family protein
METALSCGAAGQVPAVDLTAAQGGRQEDITYWTRVGTELPRSFGEQSWSRLRASIAGDIPDGTLVRASVVRGGAQPSFSAIGSFLQALVAALPGDARRVIIGR